MPSKTVPLYSKKHIEWSYSKKHIEWSRTIVQTFMIKKVRLQKLHSERAGRLRFSPSQETSVTSDQLVLP